MSDLWTRRQFNRTLGLTLLGGIFVPKYGRWFKPNPTIRVYGPYDSYHSFGLSRYVTDEEIKSALEYAKKLMDGRPPIYARA